MREMRLEESRSRSLDCWWGGASPGAMQAVSGLASTGKCERVRVAHCLSTCPASSSQSWKRRGQLGKSDPWGRLLHRRPPDLVGVRLGHCL